MQKREKYGIIICMRGYFNKVILIVFPFFVGCDTMVLESRDYMKKIQDVLKWDLQDFLQAFFGILLYSFAINIFIVPNSLYNGGILGISQLIRSFIVSNFHVSTSFDIAGLINFFLNIPLFLLAYKFVSKTFFYRTLICIFIQTVFLTFIPVLEVSIVPEILTSVLIGAILAVIGGGMLLSSGGSGGGTDIIGFMITMRNKSFSVGKISRSINVLIYFICGILYGLPTMIYSIIYSFVSSLVSDKTHKQNICSSVLIFTKEEPSALVEFIKSELNRDCTYWEGYGGYDQSKTYISYAAMSKYEMQRLERHLQELSPNAFMIKSEGIGIDGNFQKKLID